MIHKTKRGEGTKLEEQLGRYLQKENYSMNSSELRRNGYLLLLCRFLFFC